MSELADQAGGSRLFPSDDYMRGWKAASDAAQGRVRELETTRAHEENELSATINWRPAAKDERCFGGGTLLDLSALEEIFGKRINLGDLDKLRAMALVASNKQFYNEVIAAVEQHECIEIWGSW